MCKKFLCLIIFLTSLNLFAELDLNFMFAIGNTPKGRFKTFYPMADFAARYKTDFGLYFDVSVNFNGDGNLPSFNAGTNTDFRITLLLNGAGIGYENADAGIKVKSGGLFFSR